MRTTQEVLGRNGNYTQKATLGGKLPTPLDIMVEDVMVPQDIDYQAIAW
ncbi:MAG: hypothetical protein WBA93_21835 [Microcoleaceae cyanobacterium]